MDSSEPKKPFTDPKLVVYGDIQQITQSVPRASANLPIPGRAACPR